MSDLRDRMKNFLCNKLFHWAFGDNADDLKEVLLQANDDFELKIMPYATAPSVALPPSQALSTTSAAHHQLKPLPACASLYKLHP